MSRHHLALAGVRRRGAEEQAVVLGAVDSAGEVAEGEIITMPFGRATFCRTAPVTPEQSAPMIARHLVRGDQTFGGGGGGGGVDAGRVAAHPSTTVSPSSSLPRVVDFLHRHLGRVAHRRRDRFERAGEAQDHADLDVLGRGGRPATSAVAAVAKSSFFISHSHVGSKSCGNPIAAQKKRKAIQIAGITTRNGGRRRAAGPAATCGCGNTEA